MRQITIVITVHNEIEEFRLCMKSLYLFSEDIPVKIIVMDNMSSEEVSAELKSREDIQYIKIKSKVSGYGEIMGRALEHVDEGSDVLFMTPGFAITPGCLSNLQKALCEESVGLAAPVSNGCLYGAQMVSEKLSDYGQAIEFTKQIQNEKLERVVGVEPEIFMVRWEVITQIEGADKEFLTMQNAVTDYQLQIIKQKYGIGICHSALVFSMKQKDYELLYLNIPGADKDSSRLKQKWGMNYFNKVAHNAIINLIVDSNREMNILEVGCDCGANLLGIKHKFPNSKIYGIEINQSAANIAMGNIADIEIKNIECEDLQYPDGMFDYIMFGDVLEHLHNPVATLRYCKRFLRSNGYILASIPNLMHISVMEGLLRGKFTYADSGILDKTHIHMFTFYEIADMFSQSGYLIDEIEGKPFGITEKQKILIEKLMPLAENVEPFMFETGQYLIRAKKGG